MPLDIAQMFDEFIPNTAKQDRNAGVDAANVVGQLGGQAALLGPARGRQLKQSVGGLFGLDTRSPAEKLRESLGGVDISSPEGQQKAFEMISAVDGTAGIKFRAAMAEQNRAAQQTQAATTSAEAQALNAQTAQSGLSIDQQRADTQDFVARVRENELKLGEQTQEDLREWRSEQVLNQQRELGIREEANRIDERIASLQAQELGSRDKAAIREATAQGRVLREKAADTRRIGAEFKSLQPLPGAAGLVVEKWKDLTGTQDAVSELKANFNEVKNALVMDSLPPGPASDVDVALAQTGFPTASWSPEQIYSYMMGMSKLSAIAAEKEFARSAYMLENKGLDVGFDDEWEKTTKQDGWKEKVEQKYGWTFEENKGVADERFGRTESDLARQAELELNRRRLLNQASQQGFTL